MAIQNRKTGQDIIEELGLELGPSGHEHALACIGMHVATALQEQREGIETALQKEYPREEMIQSERVLFAAILASVRAYGQEKG